jgi:hypothetical protein
MRCCGCALHWVIRTGVTELVIGSVMGRSILGSKMLLALVSVWNTIQPGTPESIPIDASGVLDGVSDEAPNSGPGTPPPS